MDWELLRQQKQTQTNIYNTRENKHRVDYDYKVGNKLMILNCTAYKFERPYKGPFVITQCFTNGAIMLQCGAIKIKYNIHRIHPYKLDTKVEDFNPKNVDDAVNI